MKILILNILIPLCSGIIGSWIFYWLNNRKEKYKIKFEILKTLLSYRLIIIKQDDNEDKDDKKDNKTFKRNEIDIDISNEFLKTLMTVDIIFYNNKNILKEISAFKALLSQFKIKENIFLEIKNNKILNKCFYNIMNLILKDLKLQDINKITPVEIDFINDSYKIINKINHK